METTFYRGGKTTTGEVDTDFLGDKVRVRLLRHATRMYAANKRVGTHKTKSRGELAYRKSALFKQKGTGRARVRHPQATQCRHGAVPHGPRPRDYSYAMPKKARRAALKSALLSKFRDNEIAILENLTFDAPRTKTLIKMLDDLGMRKSCLIVTHERDDNLLLSARNLRRIEIIPVEDLNAYDLLFYRGVMMTEGALAQLQGGGE